MGQICCGEGSRKENLEIYTQDNNIDKDRISISAGSVVQEIQDKSRAVKPTMDDSIFKEFDKNITNYGGKFITKEDMLSKVSENVRNIEQDLHPIEPTQAEIDEHPNTFTRDPIQFYDNTIYHGSWNYSGKKEGYGVYVKPDGSKFSGFWKNDKINGRGRYVDTNGNYYDGMSILYYAIYKITVYLYICIHDFLSLFELNFLKITFLCKFNINFS